MQTQAAALRREIEARLADRIPAALSPLEQQAPRLLPTGNVGLDRLLQGGLPLGTLCEVTGPRGSGLSSFALTVLSQAAQEAACAYIDVNDSLSPHCAASAGVNLSNLLWVRFQEAARATGTPETSPARNIPANTREQAQLAQQHCGTHHPRGETKNLPPALQQMLMYKQERREKKKEGTPGYPNQPIGLHTASQEQVDWERFNIRRVDETDPLRRMDRASAQAARERVEAQAQPVPRLQPAQKPWSRLDGALRAADQILQAGGFRVVVLDLGSTPPEQALRVPSATWWRFQKSAQKSDAILLLLSQEPCAHSTASCVIRCTPPGRPVMNGVLTDLPRTVEVSRQRTAPSLGRKSPGRTTEWHPVPQWMRTVGA